MNLQLVTERCLHYESLPMQYTEIFSPVKIENFQWKIFDIYLIFAQNIAQNIEAVLTSTHNLCFGAKIRKIPQFYYIKMGY